MNVGLFTDNDFSKTNGVTTTLRAVLRHLPADIMARVYTEDDIGADEPYCRPDRPERDSAVSSKWIFPSCLTA